MDVTLHASVCNPYGKIRTVILALFAVYAGIFIDDYGESREIKVKNLFGAYIYTYATPLTVTLVYMNGIQFFLHKVVNKDKTALVACQGMMLDL